MNLKGRIKVSDFIAQWCVEKGLQHVFMVTGGGAMHLNHSLATHPELETTFMHHEQSCSMAADAFFRYSGIPAVVNVTTGPGGINALNGVHGAWTDSLGMIVISGQVKTQTMASFYPQLNLRQLGDQEAPIIDLVKKISKYSVSIEEPNSIYYHLEMAYKKCIGGRPGPVWIDVPIDIQSQQVEVEQLVSYRVRDHEDNPEAECTWDDTYIKILEMLKGSKSPVILCGSGIRIANAYLEFKDFINLLGIPVVTAWNAHDLVEDNDPLYAGRPGTIGNRGGNFTVQNSDLLIVLGSRLNIRQVSYNWENFAKHAKIIWVDIDLNELNKPTVNAELKIQAHLKFFLAGFIKKIKENDYEISLNHKKWLHWCRERLLAYPVVNDHKDSDFGISPYIFLDKFFDQLPEKSIIVTGNGSACVAGFQTVKIKNKMRIWTNSGSASMGYDLPAAIGAAKSSGKEVYCITGDGSIMMNLQELQTISYNNLNIKIVVLNNDGYVSIRQTHNNFFNGKVIGSDKKSGVGFPNFNAISKAFNIKYLKSEKKTNTSTIKKFIDMDGPVLLEVFLNPDHTFAPKLSSRINSDGSMSSATLEDMSPFLSENEMKKNRYTP